MRLDHVVWIVHDLDAAADDATALGFTVLPGGVHGGYGSRNVLIPLADESYLELAAFAEPPDPPLPATPRGTPRAAAADTLRAAGAGRFAARWLSQAGLDEGLSDLAFAPDPDDPDETVDALRARGLDLADPVAMGRTRPDGTELRWRMIHPDGGDLPFLVADDTPRDARVPAAPAHPNGALGVAAVTLAVRDPAASAARWSRLLGSDPQLGTDPDGRPARIFELGGATFYLVGADADPALLERVAARGEGVVLLALRADEPRDPLRLRGAAIRWVATR